MKHYIKGDGGFSYFIEKSQTHYYGVKISNGLPRADFHGTTLLIWALSLIDDFRTDGQSVFNKIKALFTPDKYKIVVIPSYRTPELVIKKAFNTFSFNHHVVKEINKKAYLSSLAIADYIIVTCDSTSMISEAALTGKPVYVAMMKAKRFSRRFANFYSQFNQLGITKELGERVDNWSYDKLDEINRVVPIIKEKMKQNGII